MAQPLETMLPKLRCPRSHTPLRLVNGQLVSQTGECYPVLDEKPVLVRQITNLHMTPPEKEIISQNIAVYHAPDWLTDPDAVVLHLGSGNVPSPDPRVISLDVLPCENVDIVSEAEELPFLSNTFDFVESGAVFEHVFDPLKAIREVRRVLKPGGKFYIDTAFLQVYHGYPGHYFNMTPQAIETFLVDDFILELSTVPDSATPIQTVVDILEHFLYYMSDADRADLMGKPLSQVLEILKMDRTRKNPLLSTYDEYPMRVLGASFVVIARKPQDYEGRLAQRMGESIESVEAWQSLKRDYYAARMGLIYRHYEVSRDIRRLRSQGKLKPPLPEPEELNSLLKGCGTENLLEPEAIRASIKAMKAQETKLNKLRDRWVRFNQNWQPIESRIIHFFFVHTPFLYKVLRSIVRKFISSE